MTFPPDIPAVIDDFDENDDDLELTSVEVDFDDAPSTGEHDNEPEGDEDEAARGPRKPRRGMDRASVRRVAAKMDDLSSASAERRDILASLLGTSSTDPVDLTVAVMTGSRSAMAPVTDLLSVADSEPMAAGITAMSLERTRMRAVWQLASRLQLIDGSIPSAEAKAALSLAGALQAIDGEHRAELDAVQALARKGA